MATLTLKSFHNEHRAVIVSFVAKILIQITFTLRCI